MLLREEMRRVRKFLEWKINWWGLRAAGWVGLDVSVAEGIQAYAHRQKSILQDILASFTQLWSAPLAMCTGSEDAGEGEETKNWGFNMVVDQVTGHSDDDD